MMVLVTMTMMMMMMMARHGSQLQPNATELEEQDERSGRRLLGHDIKMHIVAGPPSTISIQVKKNKVISIFRLTPKHHSTFRGCNLSSNDLPGCSHHKAPQMTGAL